ncbi:maleylpyruvate isomerase N-terminal domain-containing protein [Actinoplanes sp. NPDC051861]|uniref:maleylpyruvate isomerase N-terminal domain-containing protein n=1 Tax=Actinoplanes sp. NPDC051861 TaxID=3155170 RepID=UPI003421C427
MTLDFPDLLQLIDERSAAFRAAVAAAPSLDARVPSCPEWTLLDLVRHLGEGRRKWAAIIAAGPAETLPDPSVWASEMPPADDREALNAWLAESAGQLIGALREAGPDRGCWAWWRRSQSPRTAGAAARHQLQEIAVHTYDAQLTAGAPQPLPEEVALDGVEDFQFTCCATTTPWPHEPVVVEYHATEGRSWRLDLSEEGARVARQAGPAAGPAAGISVTGSASELVLFFYNRVQLDSLKFEGDPVHIERLIDWDPGI